MSDTTNTRDYGDELIETLMNSVCFLYMNKLIREINTEDLDKVNEFCSLKILEYVQHYIEQKYGKNDMIRSLSTMKFANTELKWPYVKEHIFEALENMAEYINNLLNTDTNLKNNI